MENKFRSLLLKSLRQIAKKSQNQTAYSLYLAPFVTECYTRGLYAQNL
ncbi:hypothetical protein L280_00760 [Mannheimia haemolytica MhBrain2012]|nr:hypothetical protein MHH_c26970 [Mannheimia haemolytica M42548]AGQ25206.1 hypothetical protein F382_04225 [Mannheimia haemolytica D153]AGQ40763.1 hypothetical protein J451_04465 [Mannheimia haemolytica D174]AGR75674.1 hypothetical protein N220_10340 [Mannheimia haemolytica USMARC_2286]EEY09190.1 hypothetical protein COI_2386 [Mannheimia haemolytica serotype A2 str. OVINE]EEY12220.1 hypothetical protein COK_1807 [Mannheimia haemolytica serotype A2 str. BOVINE]EPZ26796.1 hypothetical protein